MGGDLDSGRLFIFVAWSVLEERHDDGVQGSVFRALSRVRGSFLGSASRLTRRQLWLSSRASSILSDQRNPDRRCGRFQDRDGLEQG